MKFVTLEAYDRLNSLYYLNRAVSIYNQISETFSDIPTIITEEVDTHHYEWDFTKNKFYDKINNIESDIKKSASFVRTTEQAIDFIKNLSSRVAEFPDKIKSDFAKVAIGAMTISMSFTQLSDLQSDIKNEKLDPAIKSVITSNLEKIGDGYGKKMVSKIPKFKTNPSQPYSENLVNFLKYEEGDVEVKGSPKTTAYAIGDGMVTIGYGHAEPIISKVNIGGSVKMKSKNFIEDVTKISNDESEKLLRSDILKNAQYVMYYIVKDWDSDKTGIEITQPMFDAMV